MRYLTVFLCLVLGKKKSFSQIVKCLIPKPWELLNTNPVYYCTLTLKFYLCLWVRLLVRIYKLVLKVKTRYILLSLSTIFAVSFFPKDKNRVNFVRKWDDAWNRCFMGCFLLFCSTEFLNILDKNSYNCSHASGSLSLNSCSDAKSFALYKISSSDVHGYNSCVFNWGSGPGFDLFLELVQLFPLWPTM